uniref:Uncharacterized protein n=1 Tax=Anopheles dirus TaxID=7168 RepID=A0A182NTG0_9DIPT
YIVLKCPDANSAVYRCPTTTYQDAVFTDVISDPVEMPTFQCGYFGNIITVNFVNSLLEELPKNLFDTFENLRIANLSGSGIKSINRYSLGRAHNLDQLDLSHNQLRELTGYCFAGAVSLTILKLHSNNISVIHSTAFSAVANLNVLDLSDNKLETLDSTVFASLASLRYIGLDRNAIKVVERGLFSKNTAMEEILVQGNQIHTIEHGAFTSEPSSVLQLISLSNNNLTTLDLDGVNVERFYVTNNSLEHVTISSSMRRLYADNNKIASVALRGTATDMQIETLSLANNSITSLELISQLHSLKALDLSVNHIGPLNLTSFANLVNLEELDLERTFISNLQHGTFAQQAALKWLDISYNNLDQFDFDILTSSTSLQKIFLDGNRLKSVDHEPLKKTFPSLEQIGLSDNNWNCSYLIKLVRYCTEHSIELFKPQSAVQNQTNVKGIYCYDDKNPLANWNATLRQIVQRPHLNSTSEDGAVQAMLQSVLEDVRRFSETHADVANQTTKLDGAVYDLTKNQFTLQKDLNSLRQSLFEMRLALLSNRTNGSAPGVDNDELRRMIETANNLTLDKQELSAKTLDFKLYEQSFKVEKALEMAQESIDKNTVLAKRMEQWIAKIVGSGGGGVGLLGLDRQQHQGDSGNGGHSDGLMIVVLVMMFVMMGLIIFALFKPNRRPFTIERKRYSNRDSSLTTIFSCSGIGNVHNVRTVSFESSSLGEVPKSLFDTYSQLNTANLSRSGVKHINRYSLERTQQLSILDLSRNELSELKGLCFAGASVLSQLNLAYNNISVIEDTAFNTLSSLVLLQLTGNKLRTLVSNVFAPLISLKTIYLNSNELQVVDRDLFSSNTVLEHILLQHNSISVIDDGTFVINVSATLKILALSNNNLTMLNLKGVRVEKLFLYENSLKEISISPWAQHIYADNNKIASVVMTDTSAGMRLHTLSLKNNSITSLDTIGQLHSVVELYLSNNNLGPLNLTSFAKLTALEQLDLERTFISNLQHGTFAQQVALKGLDISYNNLDRFDFDILTSSTSLQKIFLDGNRLKSVDHENLKKTLPSLEQIGLSDNNWNCSYLIKLELSAKTLDFKLYEQSFKVEKALEMAKENGDKLTVLAVRVEQWIAKIVGSGGGGGGLLAQDRAQQQQEPTQPSVGSENGSHSAGLIIVVLVMVCLLMGVNIFFIVKATRRPFSIERKRFTHRDSSLTTIVDNDI